VSREKHTDRVVRAVMTDVITKMERPDQVRKIAQTRAYRLPLEAQDTLRYAALELEAARKEIERLNGVIADKHENEQIAVAQLDNLQRRHRDVVRLTYQLAKSGADLAAELQHLQPIFTDED
jgi:hypothetical protein